MFSNTVHEQLNVVQKPKTVKRNQTRTNTGSATPPNNSLSELAYKLGYERGCSITLSLDFLLMNNEQFLKDRYRSACLGCPGYLPKNEKTNKELYLRYRQGMIDGIKTQSALD